MDWIAIPLDRFGLLDSAAQEIILAPWTSTNSSSTAVDRAPFSDAAWETFGMDAVSALSTEQIRKWMEKASDSTKAAIRIFAEHGPIIDARRLYSDDIYNLAHFQSRTTVRTRTVTGDKEAWFLGWDNWDYDDGGRVTRGRYAVHPTTWRSLRAFFGLAV